MNNRRTFYVTTPIYYVNGSPHFAHAYTTVACDALARFKRLDGYDVFFLTGTDEHGQKVEQSAARAGLDPQTFCDRISSEFRKMNRLMNVTNDDFIRTTEPRHVAACQALWLRLQERAEIYLGTFAGWYAVRDEAFYDAEELIAGKAPTGAEVQWVEEPNYFFRLSAWRERLLALYEENPDFIAPASRRNEVISFVKAGLHDLSISRSSFKWGIPVPGDPNHVIYVWLDALANYISAAEYPNTTSDVFARFWPADLHMVGKDIIRFHCVYWPAFLMAAGIDPPRRVFAHGWWTVEGEKMSKSLGNFIPPHQLVERYGVDAVRYFMLRELPFGGDGDLAHEAILRRANNELANDFGNLAHRVLSMIARYCEGRVPSPSADQASDRTLLAMARQLPEQLRPLFDQQAFHLALDAIWRVVGEANRYVADQRPWSISKTDPARLRTILYNLAEVLRHLGMLIQPFTPIAGEKLLDLLAVPASARIFSALEARPLVPATNLPTPEVILPRILDQ